MVAWYGFIFLILVLLALDLGAFNRQTRVIAVREAFAWTGLWIALAFAFAVGVYYLYEYHLFGIGVALGHDLSGADAVLQFLTAYIVERSLSLDNILIFAFVFTHYRVPLRHQYRVLFWGVLLALVLRLLILGGGIVVFSYMPWIAYVLGAMLIATAVKLLIARHDNLEPDRSLPVKLLRRFFPVTDVFEGGQLASAVNGSLAVTPLFVVLTLVASADILFAFDSIPAVLAITLDPFLVFTSNAFAVLGMRALYFALAGVMSQFRHIQSSLAFVLAFVGVKMVLLPTNPIPTGIALAIIVGMLLVGFLASVFGARRDPMPLLSPVGDELNDLMSLTLKQARRIVILVIGSTLIVIGVVLLVLPGPAFIVIPMGLAVLATEFLWARRLLHKVMGSFEKGAVAVRNSKWPWRRKN